MKIHIEIDCSPEEARSFMGLPDVGKANDIYIDMMSKAMRGVSDTDKLQDYAKQLAPMGQAGLKMFQTFMDAAGNAQSRSRDGSQDTSDRSSRNPPEDGATSTDG